MSIGLIALLKLESENPFAHMWHIIVIICRTPHFIFTYYSNRFSVRYRFPFQCCVFYRITYNHWNKCWDDLMAVIEFGPSPPVESCCQLPCWTSHHCFVGVGEGYGLKKGSSYIHIIVWKTRSKISASCEENSHQNRPSVQLIFSMIVALFKDRFLTKKKKKMLLKRANIRWLLFAKQ